MKYEPDDKKKTLKKDALIYILQLLQKESSIFHPFKQQEIIDRLSKKEGIEIKRRAVQGHLNTLKRAGYDIQMVRGKDGISKGVYLRKKSTFTDEELYFMIDQLRYSPYMSDRKQAQELCERLVKGNERVDVYRNTDAPEIERIRFSLHILETLHRAVTQEKQVQFTYNEYREKGELIPVWEQPKIVNPYEIVVKDGGFYLLGNIDSEDEIHHFRLEKITDVVECNTPQKPIRNMAKGRLEVEKYLSQHPYMKDGQVSKICVRIQKDKLYCFTQAFGNTYTTKDEDITSYEIEFYAGEEDVLQWAVLHNEYIEILFPQSIRNRLQDLGRKMRGKYHRSEADRCNDAIAYANQRGILYLEDIRVGNEIRMWNFQRLIEVTLKDNGIDDISFLKKYQNLQTLRIIDNKVKDVSVLRELSKLNRLKLQRTKVDSLEILKGRSLRFLHLADNPIVDYEPLYELKELKILRVDAKTAEKIDEERLRKVYPDIQYAVKEDMFYERIVRENEPQINIGSYPYNFLNIVLEDRVGYEALYEIPKAELTIQIKTIFNMLGFTQDDKKLIMYLYEWKRGYPFVENQLSKSKLSLQKRNQRILIKMRSPRVLKILQEINDEKEKNNDE